MRIERLLLERYGHFTEQELDFSSPDIRLHVVLGANEAGKTTALHAVRDLFFGFGMRSPFDFLHGYGDLRVGAEISARSGDTLHFNRRKGKSKTLLDRDNAALRDDALVPFLGAADRPLFEGLFSLTHQSLRGGSQDLLAAGGDIGKMLFEAGGSIRHLVDVLKGLDDDAAALFTPKRAAQRKFYQALAAFNEARRRVREFSVPSDEWRRGTAELKQARDRLESAREQLRTLQTRRRQADRIRRLLPLLAERGETEKQLAEVADARPLPADSEERLANARQEIRLAAAAAEQAERDANDANEELAKLDVPEAVLAMEDEIHGAYEKRGAIRKAKEDLPNLQAERQHMKEQLENLVRELGTGITLEQALQQIPSEASIAEVRGLINRASEIEGELKAMRRRDTEARADLETWNERLAKASQPLDAAALGQAVDSIKSKGDLQSVLSDARHDEAEAVSAVVTASSALPHWTGDSEALSSLPVPDETTIERFDEEMGEIANLLRRDREKLAEAREKSAAAERELSQLLAGGDVPTDEALARARGHRDAGWRLVRRRYVDGETVPDPEIGDFTPDDPLPTAYERSVIDADRLADQRESEAARIARHGDLLKNLDEYMTHTDELQGAIDENDAVARQLDDDWKTLWSRAGVEPRTPREMAAWLKRREEVLRLYATANDTTMRVRKSQETLDQAISTLKALAPPLGIEIAGAEAFSVVLARCNEFVHAASEAANRRARLVEQRNEQELAVGRAQLTLERLGQDQADWRASWEPAIARVALGGDCSVTAAEQVLKTWERIRTAASRLSDLDYRIQAIERDSADFAAAIGNLIRDAALEIDTADAIAASVEAFSCLRDAETAAARKTDLEARRDQALKAASKGRDREALARQVVDHLRETAGCESEEGLSQAIDRSMLKTSLSEKLRDVESQILAQADGLTVDEVRKEAESTQPDRLAAEIEDIDDRMTGLMEENGELGGEINELETKLKQLELGRGAADFAQEMEDAKADLEAYAERWMVLKTATFILRRGIERFREEQQGPVLASAREIFSKLTLGAFVGFQLDYDEHDNPVLLGVRAGGDTCPVDGMSDGTRDQLFLALRIAALVNYVESAEPLPFIADDLFVHFDDDRARAGLEALIDLGATTQVLFFTHHRHLADLAMSIGRNGTVGMQRL